MPQKTSSFSEIKYGWNLGENGWNDGADENWLKQGFWIESLVDGIVESLPSAVNGQAFYLTTDNRVYVYVEGSWRSFPVPKWGIVKLRTTGETYQFNGVSALLIDNPSQTDSRIGAVESTISALGSAAFEDTNAFATRAELDVVEASFANQIEAIEEKLLEEVSVDDYGAKGDGVTDDSAAIQAAINATIGRLRFRDGATYIAQGLVPHDNLTLAGKSVIRPPVSPSNHVVHYQSDTVLTNFNIEDLEFLGRGQESPFDAVCIESLAGAPDVRTWYVSSVDRVKITNFKRGIYSTCPGSVKIRDAHVGWCDAGIAWDFEHFYLSHCRIEYCNVNILLGQGTPVQTGAHHFTIIACAIAHGADAGLKGNMSSGLVMGCSFIDNGTAHILSDGLMSNMRIAMNRFEKGTVTPYAIHSVADSSDQCVITGNTFLSNAQVDIYGSFRRATITANISRSGNRFFENTGGSTGDVVICANQVNNCSSDAILLSGSIIGLHIADNAFSDVGTGSPGTLNGVTASAGAALRQVRIAGNQFRNISATKYMNRAVDLTSATALESIKIRDNSCRNLNASLTIGVSSTSVLDGFVLVDANDGSVSSKSGYATIAAGSTSISVPHGLGYTPSLNRISVTPTASLGTASFWISGATDTTFTINISTALGGAVSFAWVARLS